MAETKQHLKIAENPLAGSSFSNWLALLRDNHRVESRYIWRAVYVTVMTLLLAPVRVLSKLRFGSKIRETELEQAPVFVLGHFRCGGTHLTNVLTQDEQRGFLSTTQALLPELFLLGKPIRNLFSLFLHEKRPMDNLLVYPESPEEPEHAICNLTPYGFYHGFCFPDRMMDYFRSSVLFEEDPTGEIRQTWGNAYLEILKACTFANQGRQLLIKNPPDTARIPSILKLFPDAKFIFLYRNPYVMFPSIRNFYQSYIIDWQLREISAEELDQNILDMYTQLMERYQRDKELIPDGNLVEVRFEDFERLPLEELQRIYTRLGLSGYEEALPAFGTYLEAHKDYQKNHYKLTPSQIERIKEHWSADIDRWGYTPEDAVEVVQE